MLPGSIQAQASAGLSSWLRAQDVALLVSAPSVDRVLLLRAGDGAAIEISAHGLPRPMGLARRGSTVWIASASCVWRFEDARRGGELDTAPMDLLARAQRMTGDLDVHDLALDADGQPLLAVTAYSCVGALDRVRSFAPRWTPPFVTALAAEDRCHLNGLACDAQGLRYVTAFAPTDTREGWRARPGQGLVFDVRAGAVILDALVLPHSPRIHNDQLWLLEAGSGAVLRLGEQLGQLRQPERLVQLPGFVRGLTFVGGHPLVTLSQPRRLGAFANLPLATTAAEPPCCGLRVLSEDGRAVLHGLDLPEPFDELYDVIALPGAAARFAGVSTDAARRRVVLD